MEEKKKVLFIVYRTEWWGCLDSYCRQECLEEDTICYVMPVPRYERDDSTYKVNFNKVHFHPERLETMLPPGARFADYREFSLEQGFERIYIHNPYDNNSLTDTVELKYYSSNLKTYTKKLIYVSHLMNLIPSDSNSFRAYDYVDAIYVPNEQARFSLDVKYDRKVEVVPSGVSEYLDRLSEERTARSQGAAIDRSAGGREGVMDKAAGKQNAQKNTGSVRKKLLYCISYNDLYQGTEKQLRKMREIFEYFRRNQEIQLIFRPDEDIRARRGMLDTKVWEGYEQLVSFYRKNRIGIYDESLDLYEAVVEADGILCASHPMAALFLVQGKYVLRVGLSQSQAQPMEERCIPAIWSAAVTETADGIELLFVPEMTKLICRMVIPFGTELMETEDAYPGRSAVNANTGSQKAAVINVANQGAASKGKGIHGGAKKKGKRHIPAQKVEVLAEVPDEIAGGLNYMFLTRVENCLYLTPCNSDGFWKYDMDTGYFGKAYLPDGMGDRTGNPSSAVFSYGKYLYAAPCMYPGIIRYDTETEEIKVIDGWVEELKHFVEGDLQKEPYFSWAVVQEGHMLYLASSQGDVWMEFDMEEDSWQMKSMNLPGMRFVHMVKEGEWVWLFPYCSGEIALWNCLTGEGSILYTVENQNKENGLAPYLFAMDLGHSIAAFPQRETDHILVIPKNAADEEPELGTECGDVGENPGRGAESGLEEKSSFGRSRKVEEAQVRKLREPLPCCPADCSSEYRRQYGCGYQFVKQLDSGMLLAYESYDGAFLLLDRELRLLRKIPCRLPAEAVRQQQDVRQGNAQCRSGFSGVLTEGNSFQMMMEYFIRCGEGDREEIRERYVREYRG